MTQGGARFFMVGTIFSLAQAFRHTFITEDLLWELLWYAAALIWAYAWGREEEK